MGFGLGFVCFFRGVGVLGVGCETSSETVLGEVLGFRLHQTLFPAAVP